MDSALSKVVIFAAGVATGAVVTWKLLKTRYEKSLEEETNALRERLIDKKDCFLRTIDEEQADNEQEDIKSYVETINESEYTAEETDFRAKPYVIAPEDFGEYGEDYEMLTLTYYADDILADDHDEIVEDVDAKVGLDSLSRFGEYTYDPDTVYVRNDKRKCDYEIIRDERNYADVVRESAAQRVED